MPTFQLQAASSLGSDFLTGNVIFFSKRLDISIHLHKMPAGSQVCNVSRAQSGMMAVTMNLTRQMKGMALNLMDRVVPVRPVARDRREQSRLNRESRRMQLYFCRSCPSSISVKRHCEKLGLRVVEKDVDRVNSFRNELVRGGGQPRVPCLRIADGQKEHWLYSPDAILNYLNSHF